VSGRGADARRRAASPPGGAAPAGPRGRNKPSFVLSLPSETAYLGLVRELTRKMAETAGFAEPVAERLSLAVDEAATNVIEHAYKGAPDREVELRFEDRGPDFRVELVDTGDMVDPRAVPQVDIDKFVTERRTGGLGMHLMERIMDSVTFRRSARRNVCALVKHKDKDGEAPSLS
jgi:anti-sigma regulatory factor (Ser/Thr protein kinase)